MPTRTTEPPARYHSPSGDTYQLAFVGKRITLEQITGTAQDFAAEARRFRRMLDNLVAVVRDWERTSKMPYTTWSDAPLTYATDTANTDATPATFTWRELEPEPEPVRPRRWVPLPDCICARCVEHFRTRPNDDHDTMLDEDPPDAPLSEQFTRLHRRRQMWPGGRIMTDKEHAAIRALRGGGCTCDAPILGAHPTQVVCRACDTTADRPSPDCRWPFQ